MHARYAAWLLPFLLTSCSLFHKAQKTQTQALAPPTDNLPKPTATHPDLPASTVTIPDQPLATDSNVKQEPIPATKHKKAAKNTQQVAAAPPPAQENPGVSAIGQLSSGDPSDQRRETENSIVATERALNGLGRALNDQEQKTAAQIREYIKQAREALLSGDVDGAKTLAVKAKVLLGELNQ